MNNHIESFIDNNGIKVITINSNDRDLNVLSEPLLRELDSEVDKASHESINGLILISGKNDSFIAGADITQISSFKTAEDGKLGALELQGIFNKIERLKYPTVAAINGACLGGGLELSLACDWRIATDSPKTKLALPEILLGLLPGAGGTQRLPRLIGIPSALDMILTGKNIIGKKALKIGLVDALVPTGSLLSQAKIYAIKKRRSKKKKVTFGRLLLEFNPFGRNIIFSEAKKGIDKQTKGLFPAPYKALASVINGFSMSLSKGLANEAKLFGDLVITRESMSFIHLFNCDTHLKKNPYMVACKEKFGDEGVASIGVIGAGFMGSGIANVCADRGLKVFLSDPSKESLGKALKSANEFFGKKLKRRRIKPFEASQKQYHISPGLNANGFEGNDIVIEAVFEDINLKKAILKGLEEKAGDNFIFATNTSAIPVSTIAEDAKDPSKVLGMHFFSPVEKMPLLEIVVTEKTADWAAGRAFEVGKTMGKKMIVVKDGPGFYTTRALAFYLNEAAQMLTEGCAIEEIDKALTSFGFAVGPIALIDEVGIDVGQHVLETIESAFPTRLSAPKAVKRVIDSGRLGRKNKKGFYTYINDKKGNLKKGAADTSIYSLVRDEGKGSKLSSDQIIDRCLLLFINESVRCLEEGILASAYDGDLGSVFGLGFPPAWGGPFKYVDHVGAKLICQQLDQLSSMHGERFKPAELLQEHATDNRLFFPDEANL